MELFDSDSDSDLDFLDIARDIGVKKKVFRQRKHLLADLNEVSFVERFRLSKPEIDKVLSHIQDVLMHESGRSAALTPTEQLLITLRFFASGSFYHLIGDLQGVSKATVCRSIKRCVDAINNRMFKEYVRFPDDNLLPQKFYDLGGMPAVAGCIDGTHVIMEAPTQNEEQFVNRHGTHSLNAMCVCGPDLYFYYVSARWPGCVHDARVLRNSALNHRFDDGWRPFPNAVLLADSAYPLKDWLIPPISNPLNQAEYDFNRAHKRTRRIIENAFGVLKERFPCLYQLRVRSPEFAGEIFKACCILHNVCSGDRTNATANLTENDDDDDINDSDDVIVSAEGLNRRSRLVNHFM